MMTKITLAAALSFATLSAAGAVAGGKSSITFGRSDQLVTKAGKKHNFKQDIEAVNKAHDAWKKAHLNPALYSCQRNADRVAMLARKVSDRIEATKKDAVASAKSLEKTVTAAVGTDSTSIPDSLGEEKLGTLKIKAEQLAKAKKQADLLERLAGQVAHFYEVDMPRESAVDGNCVAEYRAAMQRGIATSQEYHSDTQALSQKLDKLAGLAQVAWRRAALRVMLAGGR